MKTAKQRLGDLIQSLKPRHHEFWNPRVYELPFYCYLFWQCLKHRMSLRTLARANYALDHGEIGIGSKFATQNCFPGKFFLPTKLLLMDSSFSRKTEEIESFAAENGYPLILKPDTGLVGKGIVRIDSVDDIETRVRQLRGNYLVQKYVDYPFECGIFYTRSQGQPTITGMNIKHFPTVTGNGCDTLGTLAKNHPRHTHHWESFLQYHDLTRIPDAGEEIQLSFIGSHTLGCKFTDDCRLLNDAIRERVIALFHDQPGFNFGRIDVKAKSREALLAGDFVVIEVNGISSLPTHMFDPSYSYFESYAIFLEHGRLLAKIAAENRRQPMELMSHRDILKAVIRHQSVLNETHQALKDGKQKRPLSI